MLGLTRREGLSPVIAGAAAGVTFVFLLAVLAEPLLSAFLFGLSPLDAVSFGSAAAVVIASGLAACWGPGWSASRVNPIEALRAD